MAVKGKLSKAQIEANRARARLPRANRWIPQQHEPEAPWEDGLLGPETIAAGEDTNKFKNLHESLRHSWCPQGYMEELLVEKMAVCHWRMTRILRAECGNIEARALSAAQDIAEAQLQSDKQNPRPPASGQNEAEQVPTVIGPMAFRAVSRMTCFPSYETSMALAFYEAAVERHFYRAMRALAQIQKARIRGVSPAEGLDSHRGFDLY